MVAIAVFETFEISSVTLTLIFLSVEFGLSELFENLIFCIASWY